MKKVLIIMTVFVLCTGLWSCGSKEKSQFDKSTNQVVSAYGISFQIPKAWTKVVQEKNNLQYMDQRTGKFKHGLAVIFEGNNQISDALEELKYRREFGTQDGLDLKNYTQSNTTIANASAIKIEYYRVIKDTKYMYKEIVIETDKGIVIITFFSRDLVGLEDFDKVAATIKVK